MNPEELKQWECTLQKLLTPNTQTINEATVIINQQLQNPMSIISLFHLLKGSSDLGVKQLAAILCRKRIRGHWSALSDDFQNAIKSTVIEILTLDDISAPRVIKRSVADLAGSVARLTVTQGKWPNFLEFMFQLTLQPSALHREMGVYILEILLRSQSIRNEVIIPNLASLQGVIERALSDENGGVRIIGMCCFYSLTRFLDSTQLQPYLVLLGKVVDTLKYALHEDDERASYGFDCLEVLIQDHAELINPILVELGNLMIAIFINDDYEKHLKLKGFNFLTYMIDFKAKSLLSNTAFLEKCIDYGFLFLSEPEDEDYINGSSKYKYGGELLHSICQNVPYQYCSAVLERNINQYSQSPNPNHRKAAVSALAMLSEGYDTYLQDSFTPTMNMIMAALNDQSSVVRDAAFYCLGEFSLNLLTPMGNYADQIFPIIIRGMKDENAIVRLKSTYALSNCANILEDLILSHLGEIFNLLLEIVQNDGNLEVCQISVECMTTMVELAKENFLPYFGPVMIVLRRCLNFEKDQQLPIRGDAMKCIGTIFENIDRSLWAPIVRDIVIVGVKGLMELNDQELYQKTFIFFETLARISYEDLLEFLPEITNCILREVISQEGVSSNEKTSFTEINEDEDEEYEGSGKLQVLSAFMDTKVQAIQALGWIADSVGSEFAPYFPKFFDCVSSLTTFVDSDVVNAVSRTLVQLLSCLKKITKAQASGDYDDDEDEDFEDEEYDYEPGKIIPLDPVFAKGISSVLDRLLANIAFEDIVVVQSAIESIGRIGALFGPSAINTHLPQIFEFIYCVLDRKTAIQLSRDTFTDDPDEYSLFHAVLETLIDIAKVLQDLFLPYLDALLQRFQAYLLPEVPDEYRSDCAGMSGSIAEELDTHFMKYSQKLLSMILPVLTSENSTTLRNALNCIKTMFDIGSGSLMFYVPQVYSELIRLSTGKYDKMVYENICAVFCSIMNINPPGLPIDQIIQYVLNTLPVVDDYETIPVIYECILNGLKISNPAFTSHTPRIVSIMTVQIVEHAANLEQNQLEELRSDIITTITAFGRQNRQQLESIFMSLLQSKEITPENEGALRDIMSAI